MKQYLTALILCAVLVACAGKKDETPIPVTPPPSKSGVADEAAANAKRKAAADAAAKKAADDKLAADRLAEQERQARAAGRAAARGEQEDPAIVAARQRAAEAAKRAAELKKIADDKAAAAARAATDRQLAEARAREAKPKELPLPPGPANPDNPVAKDDGNGGGHSALVQLEPGGPPVFRDGPPAFALGTTFVWGLTRNPITYDPPVTDPSLPKGAEVGLAEKTGRYITTTDPGAFPRLPTDWRAKVEATVVEEGRAKKIIVFKYKPKVRYRRKNGHRQHFTRLTVQNILKG